MHSLRLGNENGSTSRSRPRLRSQFSNYKPDLSKGCLEVKPTIKCFLALGGGIGDVWRDFLTEPYYKILTSLVEDYGARTKVISQCHCAGVEDVFAHNPFVHEVIVEPWQPPTPELSRRWNEPHDGWIPIGRHDLLARQGVDKVRLVPNRLYLIEDEQALVTEITTTRPCIVVQPYAGLSDRDGFDAPALGRLCKAILHLRPTASIVVLGKNHDRGHKYAEERCDFIHPQVDNLIDLLGIRVAYHVVAQCDAFVGCHSNLIRAAWDHRRRTACVLPAPLMTDHLPKLDPKYTYGFANPEVRTFTYEFDGTDQRKFETLPIEAIARFAVEG